MTEQEWLECTDPTPMLEFLLLEFLRGKASERKLRLFTCGCCRPIWGLLTDVRWQEAVETVEQYADGVATLAEFNQAGEIARAASWDAEMSYVSGATEGLLAAHAEEVEEVSVESMIAAIVVPVGAQSAFAAVAAAWWGKQVLNQIVILRDTLGNPFRPITLDPSWLTPTVVQLAQSIYDDRAFDRLPILADALEEAGCADADILSHCRRKGPHVRGCWVVDLILGK
jgi:hypothetical protein